MAILKEWGIEVQQDNTNQNVKCYKNNNINKKIQRNTDLVSFSSHN